MSSTVKKVSLKKLSEFNTVWHEETGMVFKSQKEIIVIGKLVNKQIIPLTDVDVTICDKFKFKYEITAPVEEEEVEEEEAEEVEEGSEEVEEGAEEVEEDGEVNEEIVEETPKEVAKETPKETPKEVAKETPKEVAKETPKEVAKEVAGEDVDDFSKTINDLTRIWKSTTNENSQKIQNLEIELDKKKKEYSDLQDLYDKMKIKFDGIKQLFSL
jgi:hypothetical protein